MKSKFTLNLKWKFILPVGISLLLFLVIVVMAFRIFIKEFSKKTILAQSYVMAENINTKAKAFFEKQDIDGFILSARKLLEEHSDISNIQTIDNQSNLTLSIQEKSDITNLPQDIHTFTEYKKVVWKNDECFRIYFPLMLSISEYLPEERSGVLLMDFTLTRIQAEMEKVLWLFILIFSVSILVIILILMLSSNRIVNALKKTTHLIGSFFGGQWDLTKKVEVTSKDEIGEIGLYFNQFLEAQKGIIQNLKTESATLEEFSLEMTHQTQESASSMQEIAAVTENVVSNMKRQEKIIDEAGKHLHHIFAAFNQIAKETQTNQNAVSSASAAVEEISRNIISVFDLAVL